MLAVASVIGASSLSFGCGSSAKDDDVLEGAVVPADGPCTTGAGTTVLSAGISRGIVVDDTHVYTATDSAIVRVPRGGGTRQILSESSSPTAFAVDESALYYFTSHPVDAPTTDGKGQSATALVRAPRDGGSPELLVDGVSGTAMLSDGKRLYWVDAGGVNKYVLADDTQSSVVLERGSMVQGMALGAGALFLAVTTLSAEGNGVSQHGSIQRIDIATGALTTVIDGLAFPLGLAIDEHRIYFIDGNDYRNATIQSARIDGADRTTLATASASSIAVDAHAVYVTTNDAILKIDKATGSSSTLVSGLDTPGNVVVDGGNVYWSNATSVAMSAVNPPYGLMTACK
ncbi:hypothetical protein AKJ09_03630 [Labilithrix luteola]|uniref:Prolow-density lipoprotein receptor-related protein 1-like beta-propeller domain-containing protein n=1 Tax=Labilithrix luteola TaxID=1391654 RepID=A0A0K1PUB8_9BACT|nr:hypothetical protein AKJ09_03630 [Labilithrix luteola]